MPRRHVARGLTRVTALVQPGVVTSCIAVALSCASSRIPASLRGYDILVENRDALSAELARAMREQGFRVRRSVRGGSHPTAALVFFTFREPGPAEPLRLHIRLADTRSGAIVGATMVPLDSIGPTPRAQADAAVRALVANPIPTPP